MVKVGEITLNDISFQAVKDSQVKTMQIFIGGNTANAKVGHDFYWMAKSGDGVGSYRLVFTQYETTLWMENGAEQKNLLGWYILQMQEGTGKTRATKSNGLMPITAISAGSGYGYGKDYTYSGMPQQILEEVVATWNSTLMGDITVTTEESDSRTDEEIAAEQAQREAYAEQRRQEDLAERTGKDGIVYDTVEEKSFADAEWGAIQLYEEETIYDETDTSCYTYTKEDGNEANKCRELSVAIIKILDGSNAYPIVRFRVEKYQLNTQWDEDGNAKDEKRRTVQEAIDTETQAEAEEIAAQWIEENQDLETAFGMTEEEWRADYEQLIPERVSEIDVEVYTTTFNTTLKEQIDGKYEGMIFTTYSSIGKGYWEDAAYYSGSGKTLYLDDFDGPRVTTVGVQENPSGAVKIVMQPGFKANFELETDSNLQFIRDAQKDISSELISRDGNVFDFSLYGGDRIEIDIDNERDTVRPFLVTVKGTEWYSPEEADDEIDLFMDTDVEVLMARITIKEGWFLPDGSPWEASTEPFIDQTWEIPVNVLEEINFFASVGSYGSAAKGDGEYRRNELDEDGDGYQDDNLAFKDTFNSYSQSAFMTAEAFDLDIEDLAQQFGTFGWSNVLQPVREKVNNNPEFKEMMEINGSDNRIITSSITQEDSFITPGEVVAPVVDAAGDAVDAAADAAGDAVSGVWDSIKWYVLGGVVVLGVVILGAVWINARARRAPAPAAPVVVAAPAPATGVAE